MDLLRKRALGLKIKCCRGEKWHRPPSISVDQTKWTMRAMRPMTKTRFKSPPRFASKPVPNERIACCSSPLLSALLLLLLLLIALPGQSGGHMGNHELDKPIVKIGPALSLRYLPLHAVPRPTSIFAYPMSFSGGG